jgi:hypothetical protein
MKAPDYCVTAIGRLTRRREVITPPCQKDKAEAILARTLKVKPHKRSWIYPSVALYPKQLELF